MSTFKNKSIPIYECGFYYSVLKLKDEYQNEISEANSKYIVVSHRCKKQTCSYCNFIRSRGVADRIMSYNNFSSLRFFTLTSLNVNSDFSSTICQLEKSFRKLYKILKKTYPNLAYFKVFEVGKNGMVHLHGLWNIYIDVKELSALWADISGAYRVWLNKVRSPRNVQKYLTKYLTKTLTQFSQICVDLKINKRAFSFSNNWDNVINSLIKKYELVVYKKNSNELAEIFYNWHIYFSESPDKFNFSNNICPDTTNTLLGYFDSS